MTIPSTHKKWLEETYAKIIKKETAVIKRSGEKIPYTTENGVFDDMYVKNPQWWTNGFWMGMLWLMHLETGDEYISKLAAKLEEKMDIILYNSERTDHDVGFEWGLSSLANYRITKCPEARRRAIIAANYQMSRFNPTAGFITAWNSKDRAGWSIVDTMMNLPLLFWATEETSYTRYTDVAKRHADKTIENVVRPDGSVHHIVEYDLNDGNMIKTFGGQGYAEGSSWTRGQAWALYGFTLAYMYTKEARYLDTAKRIAHYFLAAVTNFDYVPPIDFRAPAEPIYHDTTAGAIASCGLIEIARALAGTNEEAMYFEGAMRILKALDKDHADYSDASDALLHNGSEAYPPRNYHMDIIYGDYFYMEAFFKLCGKNVNLW